MTQIPDPGAGPETPAPASRRSVAFGFLWLAIPLAALVLWAMAASSAAATGGCGGG